MRDYSLLFQCIHIDPTENYPVSDKSEPDSYTPPKFCPQCGIQVKRDGAKFCTQCGRNFVNKSGGSKDPAPEKGQSSPAAPVPIQQSGSASSDAGTSSTYTGSMEQQSQMYERSTRPRKTYDMITPSDIRPVSGNFITKQELKEVGIFGAVAYISHLMRYFLLFNEFPDLTNTFLPILVYPVVVLVIISAQKYFMRDKGIQVYIEADRFDYTRSLVFSSFFLTLLPPKFKVDKELTKVPERLYVPQSGQSGVSYQEVSRTQYIGAQARPRMAFLSNLIIAIFSFLSVLLYFNLTDFNLRIMFRIVTLYISSYGIVELAPIFGRNNELSGEYGRIRTLLIFLVVLLIFLTALLGAQFFTALQSLAP